MQTDVVEILKNELSRRCAKNPRYSLRAFARALGISPANLSLLLNRRRPPSRRTIERVLKNLDLRPLEREAVTGARMPLSWLPEDSIDLATVEKVSTPLAYAILSLMVTAGFRSDARWIASRLGVSMHEVRVSLEALESVKLIDRRGRAWTLTGEGVRINNKVTTAITRAFHRGLIEKALSGMEDLPIEERDISSITFAMSPEQMTAAKEEIRRFRLRMADLFEQPKVSTEVYNLTVQLVPITTRRS